MEKNKKILLSAYACSPTKGSEEGNGWSWATGLAKKGYEVWCFTNVAYEKEIVEVARKLNFPNLHFVFVRLSAILDKYFLNSDSKKIYIHYYLWKRKAARIAINLHQSIKFDIGHHVTYGSLQQGHFLWKLKGIKIIFGPVGGGQKAPLVLRKYFENSWKYEQIRNLISNLIITSGRNFRKSLLKADYLLVTNADTQKMAERSGYISRDKIHFSPDHAVPLSMEKIESPYHEKSKPFQLLWVGRILPRKGLNLVMEGLSRLPADFDYTLTIVGGGELFPLLPKWIKEYSLDEKRINIIGRVPFHEVIKYYEKSDVFIFCTLRDSFPMQITEALAFGLPVIALNIHGSAIALPDNCGIKITPVSTEETLNSIADAVIKLQQDDNLRKQFSENAHQYIKKQTWQNQIETVTRSYY